MFDSILVNFSRLWNPKNKALSTSTTATMRALVFDFEYEFLSVLTALQAHIDLLNEDLTLNNISIHRFDMINANIDRLCKDTTLLSEVAELAGAPLLNKKVMLKTLMQDVVDETLTKFSEKNVSLTFNISLGSALSGDSDSLRSLFVRVVLHVLSMCKDSDTVTITNLTSSDEKLSIFVGNGKLIDYSGIFKEWQLGKLNLFPMNGEGISLSAIDAIARFNSGSLNVQSPSGPGQSYKLIFDN